MIRYYCIKDGLTMDFREYKANTIYDSYKDYGAHILIKIVPNIFDVVPKMNFITLADWRDKQIDKILEDE